MTRSHATLRQDCRLNARTNAKRPKNSPELGNSRGLIGTMLQALSVLLMSYTVQRVTVISLILTKPSVRLGTPRRQCPEIMLERGVVHWHDFARWNLDWHPV